MAGQRMGIEATESTSIRHPGSHRVRFTPVNPLYLKGAVIGLAAGIVAGLFGVGGGIVIVPALVLWLGLNQRQASGTSIAAVEALALTAVISFGISGNVKWSAALFILAGSAVGALLGARIATRLPERTLTAGFAVLMLIAGIRMLI